MSKLLIESPPLQLLRPLAKAIGVNEAIVLQQIHFYEHENARQRQQGVKSPEFIRKSFDTWQSDFDIWSIATVKRIFGSLEKQDLLLTQVKNQHKSDRTKSYKINRVALESLEMKQPKYQIDTMIKVSDCDHPLSQDDTILVSKNYNKNLNKNSNIPNKSAHKNIMDFCYNENLRIHKQKLKMNGKDGKKVKELLSTFEEKEIITKIKQLSTMVEQAKIRPQKGNVDWPNLPISPPVLEGFWNSIKGDNKEKYIPQTPKKVDSVYSEEVGF